MLSSDQTGNHWKGSNVDADKIHFPTGATRSKEVASSNGRPVRYDLISTRALRRLAEVYAEGAVKHGDRNWEKGLQFDDTMNRVLAHLVAYMQTAYPCDGRGNEEDHLGHAFWGIAALIHFEELGWAKGGKDADHSARVCLGDPPLYSHSDSFRPLDRSRIETVPDAGLVPPPIR